MTMTASCGLVQEGLNTLNKKTGEIRQYTAPAIPNNAVSCLLVTRENEVWIGTDSGLCRYVAEKDSFVMYDGKSTDGIFPAASIKSLFEDSDGDLWVGTWSSGLFRYSRKEDKFYAYPKINERNSAHVIYQDSNRKMGRWLGLRIISLESSQGYGKRVLYTLFASDRG